MNALKQLGTSKTMNKDFRPLKFLFSQSKNREIPVPVFFFAFQGFRTTEFVRFYGPRQETKDLFHGQKHFLAGQPREITSWQDLPILPAREFSRITESCIKIKRSKMAPFFRVCDHVVHFSMFCFGKVGNVASWKEGL